MLKLNKLNYLIIEHYEASLDIIIKMCMFACKMKMKTMNDSLQKKIKRTSK
jgi:hypothetical protein